MTYLTNVPDRLLHDHNAIIQHAITKVTPPFLNLISLLTYSLQFGEFLSSDELQFTTNWEYYSHFTSLPATNEARILLLRPPAYSTWFGMVVVEDEDRRTRWEICTVEGLELYAEGTWMGIVPAGYHVDLKDVEIRWIEVVESSEGGESGEAGEEMVYDPVSAHDIMCNGDGVGRTNL